MTSGASAQTVTQAVGVNGTAGTVEIISPSAFTTTMTSTYGPSSSTVTAASATNGQSGTIIVYQVSESLTKDTGPILTSPPAGAHR